MSALATAPRLFGDAPGQELGGRSARQRSPQCSGGGRLTLEQRLDGVWEGLHADGAAECPVCSARMTRVAGAGRCGGCGTTLR